MTLTDPIADMLTRIRNAIQQRHDVVEVPANKEKIDIARILKEEGYIANFVVSGDTKKTITIALRYGPNNERIISGIKRISKPGLRVYAKVDSIPRVLNGLGIAIISTSTGVMTDKQARSKHVGGEVLAYIW
jgi:small subunit ribosomal protein S8